MSVPLNISSRLILVKLISNRDFSKESFVHWKKRWIYMKYFLWSSKILGLNHCWTDSWKCPQLKLDEKNFQHDNLSIHWFHDKRIINTVINAEFQASVPHDWRGQEQAFVSTICRIVSDVREIRSSGKHLGICWKKNPLTCDGLILAVLPFLDLSGKNVTPLSSGFF